jgi:monofunctional glycosyltransferase
MFTLISREGIFRPVGYEWPARFLNHMPISGIGHHYGSFISGAGDLKRVAIGMVLGRLDESDGRRAPSFGSLVVEAIRSGTYYGTLVLASAFGGALALVTLFFLVFAIVDPPRSTLMLWRSLDGHQVRQNWVSLDEISPSLVQAVVASEDARFCEHSGIDWRELRRAVARVERHGGNVDGVRGASTISMQVVKNLLLWPGRSVLRKGIEMAVTPLMELIWSKRRILEVYLNIAEWGAGIFGAEAAARKYFGKTAAELSRNEAALLATALPSPLTRNAGRPSRAHIRRARIIERRSQAVRTHLSCLR